MKSGPRLALIPIEFSLDAYWHRQLAGLFKVSSIQCLIGKTLALANIKSFMLALAGASLAFVQTS